MNWDAIGAIGEIVGALAVVVSLVYLGVQIRAQNRESSMLAMHQISQGFRESIGEFANLESADIYVRGNEDYDSLSDTERFVLIAGLQRILRVWEEAYHQYQEGRLSDKIWKVMHAQYSALMSSESFSRVWKLRRDYYDPEFRCYVDGIKPTGYKIK